ncbi:GNAT family N-acetyltransferase [Clostridium estertheticum]|uniref:GNAT family N-acetyltransferase n=1 Tax=Clostridium estertheticum TaxID=238834 RepID=UPI001C7CD265|nr:GNAT family N-acetyltransferase [Clostridium estertheticum]MBX4267259.1 GNAT family N-acetyltransferase [Clostridium estertheticum]WLC90517.1 GNAT family N-acetyltransferase [Clostridium estertheticum]
MISYKIGLECIEWPQLFNLYEKVGMLKRFIESKEFNKIQSAFQVSYKVVTAWEENTLVGSCRMLSDGICYGAVFDVAVLPEYQKKGIGKGVMRLLLKGEEHMTIHLTSTFGNEGFYKKLGFKKHKTAYSKYPFESKYVED